MTTLGLGDNKIGDEGAKALGKALEVNSKSVPSGDLLLTYCS